MKSPSPSTSINRKLPGLFAVLVVAIGSAVITGGTAYAASPAGYTIQHAVFTAANGVQSSGQSPSCPPGTVPWSGGAKVGIPKTAPHLGTRLASLTIGSSTAVVRVNNTSGASVKVTVYVVCADAPPNYQVVTSNVQNAPANSAGSAVAASCPAGTVVLGGGGYAFSTDTGVNLNGIEPLTTTVGGQTIYNFAAHVNNTSASDTTFFAEAICGTQPSGYLMKIKSAPNPMNTQTTVTASCPLTAAIVGGGVTSSPSTTSNVNSTFPNGTHKWTSRVNNSSSLFGGVASSSVICAM
jgi:hypothetical protein